MHPHNLQHKSLVPTVLLLALLLVGGTMNRVSAQEVAVNDSVYLFSGETVEIDLLANDNLQYCESTSYYAVLLSEDCSDGTVALDDSGKLQYTPTASMMNGLASDTDHLTYMVVYDESSSIGEVHLKYAPELMCELTTCVWPGDSDMTGQANASDLLSIGLGYGTSGPPRNAVTSEWVGQLSQDWGMELDGTANIDYKHADCNGDGAINIADVASISQNYEENSVLGSSLDESAELPISFEVLNESPIEAGDSVWIGVRIGDGINAVPNLYGISLRLNYDQTLVQEGSSHFEFTNSFLTTESMCISLSEKTATGFDAAISRTNKIGTDGTGIIGILGFVMEEVLIGKTQTIVDFDLTFEAVMMLNEKGAAILANPENLHLEFESLFAGLTDQMLSNSLQAYPNPAIGSEVQVSWLEREVLSINLMSTQGQNLLQVVPSKGDRNISMNIAGIPQGIYLLHLRSEEGTAVRRISILN